MIKSNKELNITRNYKHTYTVQLHWYVFHFTMLGQESLSSISFGRTSYAVFWRDLHKSCTSYSCWHIRAIYQLRSERHMFLLISQLFLLDGETLVFYDDDRKFLQNNTTEAYRPNLWLVQVPARLRMTWWWNSEIDWALKAKRQT